MKTKKEILTLMMLLIFAFVFFITVTEMPAKAIAPPGGGTYCDEGSTKYCWTSLPYWKCLTDQGGIKCVNPQGQ